MADLTALNAHNCVEQACNVRARAIHSYTQHMAKKVADAEKAALDMHQANVNWLALKLGPWGIEGVDDNPYTIDGVTFTHTGDGYLHVIVTCTDCGQEAKPTVSHWYQLGEWLDIGWSHTRTAKVGCPPRVAEAIRS